MGNKKELGALTVTRREGECLLLQTSDGPVLIRIGEFKGHQVKVMVKCAHKIQIDRFECVSNEMVGRIVQEGFL